MDQIISKLSNLGYELFGIFVPGLILLLFIIIWFWSLGELPAAWPGQGANVDGVNGIFQLVENLGDELRFTTFLMVLVLIYFFGHSLHWVSRSGTPEGEVTPLRRTLNCLLFLKLLKPEGSYYASLTPLLDAIKPAYGFSSSATWIQVFPVLKAYLAENLQTSLVSTYQNKYTLHRSIATAAAVWWWLCCVSLIAGAVLACKGLGQPRWVPLAAGLPVSFVVAWNFSSSYQYNWLMFGNTIITESFMLRRVSGK